MAVAGQLRYATEGLGEDISVACGSNALTAILDNNPALGLVSGFTADIVPDMATVSVVGKHWRVTSRRKGD